MKMHHCIVALLALLLAVVPADARESIKRFISDVTVNADGSLDVRETITVNAEGNSIRRGILRDFPTQYTTKSGTRVNVGFEVLDVQRDGHDEPFTVEGMANGKRIKIGNADVWLENGEHTYKITYHTTRQLGFFPDYDELYWNVTGNGWTFPIEQAQSIVRLPAGAAIKQNTLYTGAFGASGSDARVTQASGNRFAAETTRLLDPGEGFTIAVAWQKGIVAPPTAAELQRDWIMDNLGFFTLIATILGVAIYYFIAWLKVGRDPPGGTIVPLFHPPAGMGASGVRYVWKHGYDDKAFAAGIVGLAVKGRLKIDGSDKTYVISRDRRPGEALSRAEDALLRATPQSDLALKQSNHAVVGGMRSALKSALDDEYDGTMFLHNFGWFFAGLALTVVGLLISGFLLPQGEGAIVMFTGIFSSVWWGVILAVGWGTVKGMFGSSGFLTKIKSLMGLIFLLPFVGAGIAVPAASLFATDATPAMKWFIAAAVAAGLCNLVFYWLLKAPTPKGRQILDQIEGFRMYMTTAEEERLKVLNPPEKTPELFERYLPFAMALDCENAWNDKFAAVLSAAAMAGAATTAGWYYGNNSFGSRSFGESLGNSLTQSISAAATPPGSSSSSGGGFSGGGGSSGGGGGGGGGSGW